MKARTFDQVSAERAKAEPTPETDAWLDLISGATLGGLCRKLEREVILLRAEVLEQAQLLGMSGEKELKLISQLKTAMAGLPQSRRAEENHEWAIAAQRGCERAQDELHKERLGTIICIGKSTEQISALNTKLEQVSCELVAAKEEASGYKESYLIQRARADEAERVIKDMRMSVGTRDGISSTQPLFDK